MGFLSRVFAGGESVSDPLLTLTREAVVANGRMYTRTTCPYCQATLTKLPTQSGKCPFCGQRIAYVRGADKLVYLVRDGDEAQLVRSEVDAHWAVRQDWTSRRDIDGLRRYCGTFRGRYSALGIRRGLAQTTTGPCQECRTLQGHPNDAANAPDLPLRGCRNGKCFCWYELDLGDDRPPSTGHSNTIRFEVPGRRPDLRLPAAPRFDFV